MQTPLLNNHHWRWLIVAVGCVPIVTVNMNFLLSAAARLIPDCFVYIDGCTSISATGRYGVSYYLFKAFMLPQAILLVVFWRNLNARLLATDGHNVMLSAGITGALFLVLYTIFLGSDGDLYRMLRRYGVFVFFLGTLIAQIAATRRLAKHGLTASVRAQWFLLILMGCLALAEVPLGSFGVQDNRAENLIEWNFSLLMQLWFVTWLFVRRAPSR